MSEIQKHPSSESLSEMAERMAKEAGDFPSYSDQFDCEDRKEVVRRIREALLEFGKAVIEEAKVVAAANWEDEQMLEGLEAIKFSLDGGKP